MKRQGYGFLRQEAANNTKGSACKIMVSNHMYVVLKPLSASLYSEELNRHLGGCGRKRPNHRARLFTGHSFLHVADEAGF